jgi:hypothetical protein
MESDAAFKRASGSGLGRDRKLQLHCRFLGGGEGIGRSSVRPKKIRLERPLPIISSARWIRGYRARGGRRQSRNLADTVGERGLVTGIHQASIVRQDIAGLDANQIDLPLGKLLGQNVGSCVTPLMPKSTAQMR